MSMFTCDIKRLRKNRRITYFMAKRNNNKNKAQVIKYDTNTSISKEQMIEIQAEAYYRAIKRVEDEKNVSNTPKMKRNQYKWYEKIGFLLNFFFWPWHICKKYRVVDGIYDSVLVILISSIMSFIGICGWLLGVGIIVFSVYKLICEGFSVTFVWTILFGVFSILIGSFLTLSGKEFTKETDSNKIYAFSACIIALVSCVVSIISLIK